eukprot:13172542-Ditylum_brightwellii.AAC.1
MMSSKHNQVTLMTFVRSTQYGSDNNLLCRYRQKHLTINLLRVNEGDKTSEEGFDRDGNRHYSNEHDGDSNGHDGDGDRHDGDGYGGDGSHFTPRSLRH